jgi:hypothetical protein
MTGNWDLVEDSGELAAAVTSYTFSGLNGNADEEYQLIARMVNGYAGTIQFGVQPNADGGANYGYQLVQGIDTASNAERGVTTLMYGGTVAQSTITMGEITLNAKSGFVRTSIAKEARSITGTTVNCVTLYGQSWNNTSDNITSLKVLSTQTGGIGIGSRLMLFKKRVATGGDWVQIYEKDVATAATSVTISGLAGNTDVLYRLKVRTVNGYNGADTIVLYPNNDTGSNYGFQWVRGTDTVAGAGRTGAIDYNYLGSPSALNSIDDSETLLYAKSGYVRTFITNLVSGVSGTTVTNMWLVGQAWSNTATEITSFTITATGASGLGVGTHIELWAYKPTLPTAVPFKWATE